VRIFLLLPYSVAHFHIYGLCELGCHSFFYLEQLLLWSGWGWESEEWCNRISGSGRLGHSFKTSFARYAFRMSGVKMAGGLCPHKSSNDYLEVGLHSSDIS
jgi:hypothetical protein